MTIYLSLRTHPERVGASESARLCRRRSSEFFYCVGPCVTPLQTALLPCPPSTVQSDKCFFLDKAGLGKFPRLPLAPHMLFPSRLCSCLTAALFPRTRAPPPRAGAPAAAPGSVGGSPSGLSTTAGDTPAEFAGTLARGEGMGAIEAVAELVRSGQCRRIVVLTGAGVSVSAGIPDFRTPGTGLYDNLQEYGLPFAEAVFDLNFFRSDPAPFYRLCQELWPGRYAPTPTHRFIKLLEQKQLLVRRYTQNTSHAPHTPLARLTHPEHPEHLRHPSRPSHTPHTPRTRRAPPYHAGALLHAEHRLARVGGGPFEGQGGRRPLTLPLTLTTEH